ncbi:hypothetical protein D3C81_1715480 [compost metagenome]
MVSAMARSMLERCCGVVRDQLAKARWAAAMAASTCSVLASAIRVKTSAVAGLRMGSTRPWPATSSPSISSAVNREGGWVPAILRVLFSFIGTVRSVLGRARPYVLEWKQTSGQA